MENVNQAITDTAGVISRMSLISILYTIAALLACVIVKKVLSGLFRRALDHTHLDSRLTAFIMKVINAVMWFIIVLIMCDRLGINITSLVALFSVVGLAFSLAIQDSLSNLAGGIMLLSCRPFKIGDYVEAGGQEGTIRAIGVIYTQLTTVDNRIIYVPNHTISGGKIINYSSQPTRRIEIRIAASYDDPTDKVKASIMSAIKADGRLLPDPAPMVAVDKYGDSAITYVLRVWAKNSDYWDAYFALNERLRSCFERDGVTMTYNHLNVHLTKD